MWTQLGLFLQNYPQVAVFFALSGGYFVGKIKFFKFSLGSTSGVLLVALALGQFNIFGGPLLESIAFALFIFVIGYKVGPEFFRGLKKEGLGYISLAVVVAVVALITVLLLAHFFGFDAGTAAGLLGGGMTISTVIGTAAGAIKHLPGVSLAAKTTMVNNIAIAYAITYIFGTIGRLVFFRLIPGLMNVDLKAEAKKLETALSGGQEKLSRSEQFFWDQRIELRAYRVAQAAMFNQTVEALKREFAKEVAVDKIKRGKEIFEPMLDTIILAGDIIAIAAHREEQMKAVYILGPEVDDADVLKVIGESLDVCVLNKDYVGKPLGQLIRSIGHGCFIQRITRVGNELPLNQNTEIKKCDILTITGSVTDVERFVQQLGYAERPSPMTDLIMIGFGCILGTLIGLLHFNLFGVLITLGGGAGILLSGLLCGWLRSLYPTFGQIPDSAEWVFTELGLNLFVACIGLAAGSQALHALQSNGISLFFAGVLVTLIPTIAGLLFGRYILKLNPVFLLGALAGAGVLTAALTTVKEEAESALPAVGFTIPYAVANVLLTIWGAVIVHLI